MADNPYDIASILHEMEIELIASQKRTLQRHLAWEKEEGFEWEQWQNRKLEDLRQLRIEQGRIVRRRSAEVERDLDKLLTKAFAHKAEAVVKLFRRTSRFTAKPGLDDRNFFGIHEEKLNAILKAVQGEHRSAESAALRMMDDQYRQILFRAQVFHNSGVFTIGQAVDMASKSFLMAGIRCVEYKDGRRVNIASYSEMAIRTATARAQAVAQGAVMDDWDTHTVIIRRLGMTCDKCAPWQGRILVDDVWAAGRPEEGEWKFPMLSSALAAGLGHPNCRHIPPLPKPDPDEEDEYRPTPEQNEETLARYEAEQQQRHIESKIREYKRLEVGSIDPANRAKYRAQREAWQARMQSHLAENDYLRRTKKRESANFTPSVPPRPKDKQTPGIKVQPGPISNAASGSVVSVPGRDAAARQSAVAHSTGSEKKYTKQQAIDRLQNEHKIPFHDSKKYPINEESISEIAAWKDRFAEQYPEFAAKVPSNVKILDMAPESKIGNGVLGRYTYYPASSKNDGIQLQANIFTDKSRIISMRDRNTSQGFHAPTDGTAGVFIHEYGHHVSHQLRTLTGDGTIESVLIKRAVAAYQRTDPTFIKTGQNIKQVLSRYGASSEAELFAEAFAEYFGSSAPREFAKAFGEELDKVLVAL